ncbi:hypothetical protein F5Y10DRAFT_287706 [Nemania abortiva]|nr:hypothetical protein F5Y10DRAFT_287706 [Nemania abortiva]
MRYHQWTSPIHTRQATSYLNLYQFLYKAKQEAAGERHCTARLSTRINSGPSRRGWEGGEFVDSKGKNKSDESKDEKKTTSNRPKIASKIIPRGAGMAPTRGNTAAATPAEPAVDPRARTRGKWPPGDYRNNKNKRGLCWSVAHGTWVLKAQLKAAHIFPLHASATNDMVEKLLQEAPNVLELARKRTYCSLMILDTQRPISDDPRRSLGPKSLSDTDHNSRQLPGRDKRPPQRYGAHASDLVKAISPEFLSFFMPGIKKRDTWAP